MSTTIPANPRAGSIHARSIDDATEAAPPVYCDGDAVIDVDIDMSMLVEEWLIFICAVLDGIGMVVFIMLVVEVLVPEYAVYATESLLMDNIMLSGILVSAMVFVSVVMVLISGMGVVATGVISIEDSPAAPQRVLANA